jgi:regulator of protease activity HflC (stomatin/prohibitin superfamily)
MTILMIVLMLISAASGFRRTQGTDRLLIFRLGRVYRLFGPGITWIIPVVDMAWRVNLDKAVPHWRSLSESELIEELIEYGKEPAPPLT